MFPSLLRKLTTCTRTQQSSGRNEQAFLLYRGCSSLDVLPQSSASLQPTRSSVIKKRSPLFLFCLIKYSFSCKTSFPICRLITPSCLKLSAILNFSFVLSAILLSHKHPKIHHVPFLFSIRSAVASNNHYQDSFSLWGILPLTLSQFSFLLIFFFT